MSDTLWEYVNHKESKLEGNEGILERKHVEVNGIVYIGKETENIENTGVLDLPIYTIYPNENSLKEKIMKLTSRDARIIGLNLETLRRIKKRIYQNKYLKMYKNTLNKLK